MFNWIKNGTEHNLVENKICFLHQYTLWSFGQKHAGLKINTVGKWNIQGVFKILIQFTVIMQLSKLGIFTIFWSFFSIQVKLDYFFLF